MTDRPSLEDLDAASESARWCCEGNAEDCLLRDTATLPYPWICPGHPDTETNRRRVQAATEAPQPAPWSQLEAHAFNRVQRLVDEYPVGLDTALIEEALDDPRPAHDPGPTAREAAAQDRAYWERKDAGEKP